MVYYSDTTTYSYCNKKIPLQNEHCRQQHTHSSPHKTYLHSVLLTAHL